MNKKHPTPQTNNRDFGFKRLAAKARESYHRLANLSNFRRLEVASLMIATLSCLAAWMAVPEFRNFFRMETIEKVVLENLTYENSTYGIRIQYPPDWQLQEVENPISGTIARFLPQESESDNFYTELIIDVEELTKPMSLAEYTTSSIQEIEKFTPKGQIIDSSVVTLANRKGYKVIYKEKDEKKNLKLKSMQLWMLKNDRAYIITYTAEKSKYSYFLKPVEDVMIKSLNIQYINYD